MYLFIRFPTRQDYSKAKKLKISDVLTIALQAIGIFNPYSAQCTLHYENLPMLYIVISKVVKNENFL